MEKIEKTYTEINSFLSAADKFLKENEKKDSKLNYALKKVIARLTNYQKQYNEKLQDLRLDYVAVDEKGYIIKDEKGEYKFTPEKAKALNKAVWDLEAKSTFEVEPFYCEELPEDFDAIYEDFFTDFVLKRK